MLVATLGKIPRFFGCFLSSPSPSSSSSSSEPILISPEIICTFRFLCNFFFEFYAVLGFMSVIYSFFNQSFMFKLSFFRSFQKSTSPTMLNCSIFLKNKPGVSVINKKQIYHPAFVFLFRSEHTYYTYNVYALVCKYTPRGVCRPSAGSILNVILMLCFKNVI